MAHKEWKAIVQDWGAVPADKRNQSVKPSGVRSNDQGEAARKESGQAVRCTTETNSAKDREV